MSKSESTTSEKRYKIFAKSLSTLTEEFPIKAMEYGVDVKLINIHGRLLSAFANNAVTKEELRKKAKFSDYQLTQLEKFKAVIKFDSDNTYLVRDFNWDTMEESA